MRQRARVDEALDGLTERDQGADEDSEHHREAGPALAAGAAEEEGDAERDRRQRVAEVVDQVGEQGDTQRLLVDERLREAVTVRIARLHETARIPARERTIDGSTGRASARDVVVVMSRPDRL